MNLSSDKRAFAVEHFQYRTTEYKPRPELKHFIEFATSRYYSESDSGVIQIVRRAIDEMGNDQAIRFSVNLTDESNADYVPAASVKETYTAYNSLVDSTKHRIVSFGMISGMFLKEAALKDFTVVKGALGHLLYEAHPGTDRMVYPGSQVDREVSFMGIRHQIQMLVTALSNTVKFFERHDHKTNRYYLVGRPHGQRTSDQNPSFDPFQILIILQVPVLGAIDTSTTGSIAEAA